MLGWFVRSHDMTGDSSRGGETPRVLIATNMYPSPDDPARGAFVQAQVDALVARDLAVRVFLVRGERQARRYALAIAPLRQVVRSWRADVVYAFYGLMGWVALWQPAPVVLSLAGDDVLGTPNGHGGITWRSRVGMLLTQWAARRAVAVCVQSEEMHHRLWGAGLRRRAVVIPYGVDHRRFCPGPQREARRSLGLPLDRPIVIFPNTPDEPRKRLALAQAAMTLVRREFPDAVLQVVAGVPHDAMPDYYRGADCCLLTSEWEGSPNVVKEALLSGLPVVSTDVGDVRRWVSLSAASVVAESVPARLAAAVCGVLRSRKREHPAPFIAAFSSQAIVARMLPILQAARTVARR